MGIVYAQQNRQTERDAVKRKKTQKGIDINFVGHCCKTIFLVGFSSEFITLLYISQTFIND